jgi:beta-glucosidase
MAMTWESENLPAIVQAWYPGQNGGTAIADVLFGRVNPSGRLPVTFYRSTEDLPAFEDYSMSNRTYRYFSGKPLYPFGHGLSYTHFTYGPMETVSKEVRADGTVSVRLDVKNTGKRDGDEVAQLYVKRVKSASDDPVRSLAAFQRFHLAAGASTTVRFEIPAAALRHWDAGQSRYVVDPGEFEILAGASAGDIRQTARMRIVPN